MPKGIGLNHFDLEEAIRTGGGGDDLDDRPTEEIPVSMLAGIREGSGDSHELRAMELEGHYPDGLADGEPQD